jgi:hypothetical protein
MSSCCLKADGNIIYRQAGKYFHCYSYERENQLADINTWTMLRDSDVWDHGDTDVEDWETVNYCPWCGVNLEDFHKI